MTEDGSGEEVFVEDGNGSLQGIYFSATDEGPEAEDQQPDVVRLLDENQKRRVQQDTGMLESISSQDLQNTDLLIFRAATGELVLERRGLRDEEVHVGEVDVGDEGKVGYRLFMRGPVDSSSNIGGLNRQGSFTEWATDYQLTEPFQSRDSFHLQPGEWVEVVAINRTTGYMGTERVQLTSAANPDSPGLSVKVDGIKLRPPNLKVWAERDHTVDKGLEAGDERKGQIIGSEGAGLQSDDRIIVHTEWLDHDGSALPEGLSASNGADFGLTGRLAKVVGPDLLQADGVNSDLAEFPIRSGKQKQILKFGGEQAPPEHYYLHVIGKARNQQCQGGGCPDFDTTGSEAGLASPFDTRPRYVTPFLTPHYDEKSHWLAFNEYRRLKREQADPEQGEPPTNLQRPAPTYVWNYRPEYQFSRYDLEVAAINRVKTDDDTDEQSRDNILDAGFPGISTEDDLTEVLYSLVGPEFDRLAPIDGEQEFVLALGAEETRVTIGEDNKVSFDSLKSLEKLDPEEFLSLRLFLNHDAGNVLWEWGFGINGLHVHYHLPGQDNPDLHALLEMGEDEREIVRNVGGLRLKYRYQPPRNSEITEIQWRFQHDGWYCQEPGFGGGDGCSKVDAGEAHPGFESDTGERYVWWEPANQDNQPVWETGLAIDGNYNATTVGSVESGTGNAGQAETPRKGQFQIVTRELEPVPDDPMEGADVQILEALLWQLGMSPDHRRFSLDEDKNEGGQIGINAERLSEDKRDHYGEGGDTDTVAKMVGRFNYINWGTKILEIDQETVVNQETLQDLRRHWRHWLEAHERTGSPANFHWDDLPATTLQAAETVFDGPVRYPGGKDFTLASTYTEETQHDAVERLTGSNFERWEILKAMAEQESGGQHWVDHRIVVGAADEAGSKGFNQIQNKHTYGGYAPYGRDGGGVDEIVAYEEDGRTSNVNHYHPGENIVAKAVWLAKPSGGAMHVAFDDGGFSGQLASSDQRTLRVIRTQGGNGEETTVAGPHENDAYELLSMAVGAYNQGAGAYGREAWAALLTDSAILNEDGEDAEVKKRAMNYAMDILHGNLDLPYRDYIWEGGTYPETDSEGNPHPMAGQEWCFAYGEEEWRLGKEYSRVREETERFIFSRERPSDTNARASCQ